MSLYVGLEPTYLSHYTQSFTSNGVTSVYALTINPGSSSSIIVNQDGVVQRPGIDYTVQLGNLVFIVVPPAAETGILDNIFVTYLGVMVSIPTPAANTVGTAQLQDGSVTAAKLNSSARGAVGGGTDKIFYENDTVITTNYTITTGKNAITGGPVTVNTGVTVTVPTGSTWTIV